MNERTEKVFRGYVNLTPTEQAELVRKMNEYIKGSIIVRESIERGYKRVALGPEVPTTCPCCGR